jgi:hypothetical protein
MESVYANRAPITAQISNRPKAYSMKRLVRRFHVHRFPFVCDLRQYFEDTKGAFGRKPPCSLQNSSCCYPLVTCVNISLVTMAESPLIDADGCLRRDFQSGPVLIDVPCSSRVYREVDDDTVLPETPCLDTFLMGGAMDKHIVPNWDCGRLHTKMPEAIMHIAPGSASDR